MMSMICRRTRNGSLFRSYSTASNDTKLIAQKLMSGNRGALSRAITLVESKLHNHYLMARQLLSEISNTRQNNTLNTVRIGISGPPGVGKSTFIEELGSQIISKGDKVAVLAVDPSSTITGGSILGDKTRMTELAGSEMAYVRPSPSG
ncbi:GTPase, partial [Acrasis kona]